MNIDNRVANIVYTYGPILQSEVTALYASQYDVDYVGYAVAGAVTRLMEAKVIEWNSDGRLKMVSSA